MTETNFQTASFARPKGFKGVSRNNRLNSKVKGQGKDLFEMVEQW